METGAIPERARDWDPNLPVDGPDVPASSGWEEVGFWLLWLVLKFFRRQLFDGKLLVRPAGQFISQSVFTSERERNGPAGKRFQSRPYSLMLSSIR